MKKTFKKTLVCGLAVAMVVTSMTGCGSKSKSNSQKDGKKGSKVTVELSDVLEGVVVSLEDVDSVGVDVNGKLAVSGKADGEKVDVSGSLNVSGNASLKDLAFDVEGKVNYEANAMGTKLSGDYDASVYGSTKDGEMEVYYKDFLGDTYVDTMDVSDYENAYDEFKEAMEMAAEQLQDIDLSELDGMEELDNFVKLENMTEYVNGKECYVLSANLDMDTLEELAALSGEDLDDIEEFENIEDFSMKYALYFDKKSYVPTRFEFGFAGKADSDGETVSIDECSLTIDLKVDGVKVKSAPKDVKKDAEESDFLSDGEDSVSDLIGGFDDDYDYDDYDYDDYDYDDDDFDFTSNNDASFDITNKFTLEGKEYTLPVDTKQFVSNGWKVEEMDADTTISGNDYEFVYFENGDKEIMLMVANNSNSTIKPEDGKVYGISASSAYSVDFALDNGLKLGDKIDDVKKFYKEDASYESEYSVSYMDEDYNEISFSKDDDIVSEIEISLVID